MSEVIERVIELFDSTCEKQFESMHCDIHSLNSAEYQKKGDSVCASINCYSDDIEITLIITATKGFLVNTIPLIGGQRLDTVSFQNDWCLELANRFLGRLKNKLLSHDCLLNMGLPVLVGGSRQAQSSEDFSAKRVFQVDGLGENNQIQCALGVTLLNPDMTLEDYEDEDEDWFDESELLHL
tara:strand:+ start:3502 stop:4047 length:546 start_codon:yes stop_codon:yes gene_type:complete